MHRSRFVIAFACACSIGAVIAADERLTSSAGDIVLRPLAHSMVQVEFAGRVIYVDPWRGADLTSASQSDLILITDADSGAHHLDTEALARLRKPGGVVVMPASGAAKVPDGTVLANGARRSFGNVTVEAIGSYDLTPGEPFHAKGVANGYLLTMGGKRVFFAGVTECVPEIKALRDVEVAFMPMNLPHGRMTPAKVADCVRSFKPKIVYPYHYDQGYIARRAGRGNASSGAEAAASVKTLRDALQGAAEVRDGNWYPAK